MRRRKGGGAQFLVEVVTFLIFIAVFAGISQGVSFLRGLTLHRVCGGKAEALVELVRNSGLASAAGSVSKRSFHGERPEPAGPYLVVLIPQETQGLKESTSWEVIAWTGKDPGSLDEIQTVVFCRYGQWTARYGPAGGGTASTTGTSEYVSISYVNAKTGEQYDWEEFGRELPGSASRTPHYKVSINKLLSHIKKQLG